MLPPDLLHLILEFLHPEDLPSCMRLGLCSPLLIEHIVFFCLFSIRTHLKPLKSEVASLSQSPSELLEFLSRQMGYRKVFDGVMLPIGSAGMLEFVSSGEANLFKSIGDSFGIFNWLVLHEKYGKIDEVLLEKARKSSDKIMELEESSRGQGVDDNIFMPEEDVSVATDDEGGGLWMLIFGSPPSSPPSPSVEPSSAGRSDEGREEGAEEGESSLGSVSPFFCGLSLLRLPCSAAYVHAMDRIIFPHSVGEFRNMQLLKNSEVRERIGILKKSDKKIGCDFYFDLNEI